MKTFMALSAVAAMGLASPALSAELITNGGFETGNFSGWTPAFGDGTDPVVIGFNNPVGYPNGAFGEGIPQSPSGGNFTAYFSSDTANPDAISQSVNVTAGQTYSLSFNYYVPQNGFNNPNDATLNFLINGAPAGSLLQAGSASGTTPVTWHTFTTSWLATSTGAVPLEFQFRGLGVTAADFAIDNVSMTAVPEPATWALLIAGFALVGVSMRRRHTSISFA